MSGDRWPWHHDFALAWEEFFLGTGVRVQCEVDTGLEKQPVDLVITRGPDTPLPATPPDGFADLAEHTVLTFKSHQDALTGGCLLELAGHFVNYCKRNGLEWRRADGPARMVAVTAREPQGLRNWAGWRELSPGVHDVRAVDRAVRVVVLRDLPEEPHNAALHLFSARDRQVQYAVRTYRPLTPGKRSLLWRLLLRYGGEVNMPITLEELIQKLRAEALATATPEERLAGLPPEQLLAHVPPEQRLAGLSPEQRLAGLSPEEREALARLLRTDPKP